MPHAELRAHLEALYRRTHAPSRLEDDPVAWARRYADPRDAEVAGLLAASFAYGRVSLFRPVLARLFALADARGGPRAWVDGFDPAVDGPVLGPLVYRWNRGVDVVLLLAALRRVLARVDRLEALLGDPSRGVRAGLTAAVDALRAAAVEEAPRCGVAAARFDELPRGFRTFLPSPADGSACKRLNMYLRWMVRPSDEGIDLGIWARWTPDQLVIPLDTHVLRVARFLGLTRRKDGSWRTAEEITDALRACDPRDPVRYDFSLAHLGISGSCRGHRDAATCPSCPLDPVCAAPRRRETRAR